MDNQQVPDDELGVIAPKCCEDDADDCCCKNVDYETIIVEHDEAYDNRNTIYYHCDDCGEYFKVIDIDTKEVLFSNCCC
jgi:hypothetical protein